MIQELISKEKPKSIPLIVGGNNAVVIVEHQGQSHLIINGKRGPLVSSDIGTVFNILCLNGVITNN
jgi:hypothetical protein